MTTPNVPRCDGCQQPLIGTALCGICAAEAEAYRAEMDRDYWDGEAS